MPERFLKVPHIQQKSSSDCLVACAAMMLEFAGFRTDYSRLLRVLGTTTLGTPHNHIQRLSGIYSDLHLVYELGELADIIFYIDQGYPVGIFVDTRDLPYWYGSFGHAVVAIGYSEGSFYLHDPEFSETPQTVSYGDLLLAWQEYNFHFVVVQRKQKPQ